MTANSYGAEYVQTGLADVDAVLDSGLMRDGLILLTGAPKSGKTALALSIASNVNQQGASVLFFSTEMTERMLLGRMVALEMGVPLSDLNDPGATARAVAVKVDALRSRNMRFVGHPLLDVQEIRHAAEGAHEDAPVSLVVIDGLLWPGSHRQGESERGDARALFALRQLAHDLHAPLLVTKSRFKADRTTHEGSSLSEAVADVTLHIQRGDPQDMLERRQSTLSITANRHGETGSVPLFWQLETGRFTCLRHVEGDR